MQNNKLKNFFYFPRYIVLALIFLYQKTLSPDHGLLKKFYPHGFCRYYPTCSDYGYQIIKKRGMLVGIPKTLWRIVRCNPWSKGGIDTP